MDRISNPILESFTRASFAGGIHTEPTRNPAETPWESQRNPTLKTYACSVLQALEATVFGLLLHPVDLKEEIQNGAPATKKLRQHPTQVTPNLLWHASTSRHKCGRTEASHAHPNMSMNPSDFARRNRFWKAYSKKTVRSIPLWGPKLGPTNGNLFFLIGCVLGRKWKPRADQPSFSYTLVCKVETVAVCQRDRAAHSCRQLGRSCTLIGCSVPQEESRSAGFAKWLKLPRRCHNTKL